MTRKEGEEASPASSEQEQTPTTADEAGKEATAETDANAAESSDAGEPDAKQDRPTLSDVLQDAVKPKDEGGEPSDPEGEAGKAEAGADADAAKAEEAEGGDAEDKDSELPFHNHPRFQKLLTERNAWKEPAERYGQITSFMTEHDLSAQEVAEGFYVMSLLKSSDPAKLKEALEWFEPRITGLRDTLGLELPEDLAERLDAGEIDEATAGELARNRADAKLRTEREKRDADRAESASKADDARKAQEAISSAVSAWEDGIRKTDPDYARKAEMVEAYSMRLMASRQGSIRTPDDAVALAKEAYAAVNKIFKDSIPRPKPKDTTTPAGTSARTITSPATMREALEASIAG